MIITVHFRVLQLIPSLYLSRGGSFMNQSKKLGIVYLITFAIMIFLNYWSATNVGNVADANQPLLQPAGFAFSIWGFIYFLLFIWIIRAFS